VTGSHAGSATIKRPQLGSRLSMVATADAATGSGSSANVLSSPDAKTPTSFYWSLTLLATVGGFPFGYDTSNIGSALNFVPYHLTASPARAAARASDLTVADS
jgi:hypothetical protein